MLWRPAFVLREGLNLSVDLALIVDVPPEPVTVERNMSTCQIGSSPSVFWAPAVTSTMLNIGAVLAEIGALVVLGITACATG